MKVYCPSCEWDFEIPDENIEFLQKDGYIEDYECPECGERLDIEVEEFWNGLAHLVFTDHCDKCNKEVRARNIYRRDTHILFPMNKKYGKLCPECYRNVLKAELDARNNYIMSLGSDEICRIFDTYKSGMRIHINEVKNPYFIHGTRNLDVVVDHIHNERAVACRMPSGEIVKLFPGYDDFIIIKEDV